ncbi:amino acid/amide ABC transporter substrate-binding protein, HAAT family [Loktanella fryxellensis]|uniref:Amino acid/amide ABC transporter substrate-binding protein, HAAT family n=1 Tax=Loktanella fryxellensis TaxID=245187 RepID=A0A1H8DDX2_9RHOB|nr:penicillin-binding protein activator [Loktanella fryxellensis]SEN04994.1 amino acid/amide ABC transporter substrate-binding protein, HAAT family [Loktanella fryxellensis]
MTAPHARATPPATPTAAPAAARRLVARATAVLALVWTAACVPLPMTEGTNTGAAIDPSAPVQVALLVPAGSGDGNDAVLARNLENAARLAISDLSGVEIDLRVYNSGADAAVAAQTATRAADEGAMIILGPLYGETVNPVGNAVASRNINVLALSNNPTVAGGNVFILGSTFNNTANRLVAYARGTGIERFGVVHANDLGGQLGRDAITAAVQANGAQVAGVGSYPLSQQGITGATTQIATTLRAAGAQAVFLTAGANADLPLIATALPEAGIDPVNTRYIGLTNWAAVPQALALPGVQGGLFAVPDRAMAANFEARYAAAYGDQPHPLAGLAYDGIAAIGALVATGRPDALTKQSLTTPQGFQGTNGIFRLLPNGLNERGLAVATVRGNEVVILENAPRSFDRAGS